MMNGLKLIISNRLEALVDKLAQMVRQPSRRSLGPEVVVVQSRGMQRWVSLELARRNGICANFQFPFPNAFLEDLFKLAVPDLPDRSPFDPNILTFRIMHILPDCINQPEFKSLRTYLEDDAHLLKLYQLSKRVSDTFDQYLIFRPEMILAWEAGRAKHWQARLWREVIKGQPQIHRAWLRKRFSTKIRKRQIDIERLPERVSIFGISYLPPFYMHAFAEIALLIPVHLFVMNPCREYWSDILSEREITRVTAKYAERGNKLEALHLEQGNRLLASMGAVGKNFISLLNEFECEYDEYYEQETSDSILANVHSDLLNLVDNRVGKAEATYSAPSIVSDSSMQIHSCHSPLREIEILHDNLLAMFEANPGLKPKDIVVMTPDIEAYAPYIHAIFDSQVHGSGYIPFSVADQSPRTASRLVNGFLELLDLKGSRLGVTPVLEFLQIPGVKERFDLSENEIGIIEEYVARTYIRWGKDKFCKEKRGLPAFKENTWQAGIERLLLGLALPGNEKLLFNGILPYDHIEGQNVKILGNFFEYLDRLFRCLDEFEQARTLRDWRLSLLSVLEVFFAADESFEPEIQLIRSALEDLAQREELSGFNRNVDIEIVGAILKASLEEKVLGTGFLSQGVTFCAILPMRSIPFEVICLVGMNIDSFPRDSGHLGFDLMAQNPRPGDRSRRDDDKYLFLEAILSARKTLYLSYVGQDVRDNTHAPPSVLVSELIDYVAQGYRISKEELVTRHRLQPFASQYFDDTGSSRLFSYSKENFQAAQSMCKPSDPIPFIEGPLLRETAEKRLPETLSIDDLCLFFNHPVRYLLQKRLNLFLEQEQNRTEDHEAFILNPLQKFQLAQTLLKFGRTGGNLGDIFSHVRESGILPHGSVGEVIFRGTSVETESFIETIAEYARGDCAPPLDVELKLEGVMLYGELSHIYESGSVHVRYTRIKAKYLLAAWICHLVYCVSGVSDRPLKSCLIGSDAVWEFKPVNQSRRLLQFIIALYRQGLSTPIHFFPESAFIYVLKRIVQNRSEDSAREAALNRWLGSDFAKGESADVYYDLCFRDSQPPLDDVFTKNAMDVFEPILQYGHKTEL